MPNSQVSTIIGYATNILKIDADTIGVPGLENTQLLSFADQANREYHNAHLKAGGELPSMMARETGGTLVSATTLASSQASNATTAVLTDGTNFDSSGAFAVYGSGTADIEENLGKTTNTLTGVTGVGFAHDEGDVVAKLYSLPSSFGSLRQVEDAGDGVVVNGVQYYYTSGIPIGNQVSIYNNGTSKWLWFPQGASGDYLVHYNKTTESLDDLTDVIDIPVDDEYFMVWRIIEMGREVMGDDPARIQQARQRADSILLDALKRRNIGKLARVRPIVRRQDTFWPFSDPSLWM